MKALPENIADSSAIDRSKLSKVESQMLTVFRLLSDVQKTEVLKKIDGLLSGIDEPGTKSIEIEKDRSGNLFMRASGFKNCRLLLDSENGIVNLHQLRDEDVITHRELLYFDIVKGRLPNKIVKDIYLASKEVVDKMTADEFSLIYSRHEAAMD